ncbi:MAG: AAA family ATPase, partial [Dehalococcoidia bacterium]|nr:AAA family ATPase [Dehalococcoidia bacterium]
YIADRFLPDKAIDLIDEASSRVQIKRGSAPSVLKDAKQELNKIRKDKDTAINTQQYEQAAELRDKELKHIKKIRDIEQNWKEELDKDKPVVNEEDIAEVVSMWTKIPVTRLASDESKRLLKMEEVLHQRIIGQDEAITAIAKAVRRARAGIKDLRHPVGVFMFLGPTGVGKTELARALAEFMFDSEDSLIRLDMSEFMESHAVARLVGAPPGYVGYDQGGQLTEAVRRNSYCAILLDEIEKAHPDVSNILLQIFDDGHLTDAKGRKVNFRNSIIIMTSNIGAELIRKGTSIGFVSHADEAKGQQREYESMKDKVLAEVKKTFRPEFLNRIDSIVVFHSLTKEQVREIVDIMLETIKKQLSEKELQLEITDAAKDFLVENGFDQNLGARPMRRFVQDVIENPLSEKWLGGEFQMGDIVNIDVSQDKDKLVIYSKNTADTAAKT